MYVTTATQAKTHFGEIVDKVQLGNVHGLKHGHLVGVMVSAQDHEAMRNVYVNSVFGSLALKAASATAQGLTEDGPQRLLDDES